MTNASESDSETLHPEKKSLIENKAIIDKLQAMSEKEVVDYFATLDAPSFQAMNGEFDAIMVGKPNFFSGLSTKVIMFNPYFNGMWQSKSFTPGSGTQGHGYNCFQKNGKIKRQIRMKTQMANSLVDGKPVFQLHYASYKNMLGLFNTIDEVRVLAEGLYLGIATWGPTQHLRTPPQTFILSGPRDKFVGADRKEIRWF